MDQNFLEKMQKWDTYVTLLGVDNDMQVNGDTINDDNFYGDSITCVLSSYLEWNAILNDPPPIMKAAMHAHELGISTDDIDEYHLYIEEQETIEEQKRRDIESATNSCIVELIEKYNFKFLTDVKRYPKHTHYEFTMPNGIVVRGRTFRPTVFGGNATRVWTSWRDSNNVLISQYINFYNWDSAYKLYKTGFPTFWKEVGSLDDKQVSYLVAWRFIINDISPFNTLTLPK
jgi:hypothetical protein